MKYLVMGKTTGFPGMTPTPPDVMQGLNVAARTFVKERLEDGSFDCHYVFADGGGFAIVNADSHEGVLDLLLAHPLSPIFVWEVKVLCDWEHSYDKFTEFWGMLQG